MVHDAEFSKRGNPRIGPKFELNDHTVHIVCGLLIVALRARMPNHVAMITFPNLLLAFGMVLVTASISSYIGIRRVLSIDPFEIFRV